MVYDSHDRNASLREMAAHLACVGARRCTDRGSRTFIEQFPKDETPLLRRRSLETGGTLVKVVEYRAKQEVKVVIPSSCDHFAIFPTRLGPPWYYSLL